jgi:hypothetical protein
VKDAKDLIPWKVTDLPIRPYDDFWSFNNSIHFDGTLWRCAVRCCDYAMPDGVTIRSKKSGPLGQQTKNAMVILDPDGWKVVQVFKMHERDGLPRASTPHVGYEDMRIFRTDAGGLQGIAASLHLRREAPRLDGSPTHQPPEQVVVSFDDEYNIVAARPIRGEGWSSTPQKNWVPFDDCVEPRFLYSIYKGTMFDDRGSVHGGKEIVRPSVRARPLFATYSLSPATVLESSTVEQTTEPPKHAPVHKPAERRLAIRGGGDVQAVRGRRILLDAMSSRPSRPHPSSRPSSGLSAKINSGRGSDESARVLNTGRVRLPTYNGLRGGTQLVRVGDDAWLGIGHEMRWVNSKKFYWHTWYTVDSKGALTSASEPMKLAPNGIEFAAGLAIDGDHAVVSFGVDDHECKLAETSLSAVLQTLRPIER